MQFKMRTARKNHHCDGHDLHPTNPNLKGAPCMRGIVAGEVYGEGEVNPYRAGGFGHDRYCDACVATMSSNEEAA